MYICTRVSSFATLFAILKGYEVLNAFIVSTLSLSDQVFKYTSVFYAWKNTCSKAFVGLFTRLRCLLAFLNIFVPLPKTMEVKATLGQVIMLSPHLASYPQIPQVINPRSFRLDQSDFILNGTSRRCALEVPKLISELKRNVQHLISHKYREWRGNCGPHGSYNKREHLFTGSPRHGVISIVKPSLLIS